MLTHSLYCALPYELTRSDKLISPHHFVGSKKPEPENAGSEEEEEIIDPENPRPSPGAQLPCAAALEFLADVYEKEGGREKVLKAVEVRFYFPQFDSIPFEYPLRLPSFLPLLNSEEKERTDEMHEM